MRKAYVTRYSAFGDMIHASHVPRLVKERLGFDHVTFEGNYKACQIMVNNPFIDDLICFDPSKKPFCEYPWSFMEKRWAQVMQSGGFERHFNLYRSIEYGYIAMEDMPEYYMNDSFRREKYGKMSYYDVTTKFIGLEECLGTVGEVYFTEEEENFVKNLYRNQFNSDFVIVCNLSGTSMHKMFYKAEEIIKEFLSRHPEAICITVGDENCRKHAEFSGERIINRAGNFRDGKGFPFRQSMLVAKYADMAIGCESGLMVAATLFGVPTVQLMTAASIKNHGGDFPNDYSLQSPCRCSPCHKGPYQYVGCPSFEYMGLRYPKCIVFDKDVVLERMEQAYSDRRESKAKQTSTSEVSALR